MKFSWKCTTCFNLHTRKQPVYIGSSVTPILLIIFLFFLYSVHNDNLYCERHYAENLKPRCGACDELIFDGQYTKVSVSDFFRFRLNSKFYVKTNTTFCQINRNRPPWNFRWNQKSMIINIVFICLVHALKKKSFVTYLLSCNMRWQEICWANI